MTRARMKDKKKGKKRKQQLEKYGSTPTKASFFGDTKPKD